MAVALQQKPLTYEDYLAEGEVEGRYEIIDGVRYFMTSPSTLHQIIFGNLGRLFSAFQISSRAARALLAPVDITTKQTPLVSIRQPDVMLISKKRFGKRKLLSSDPLECAPELVVEILSPSESRRMIAAKLGEYSSAGVLELWIVSPQAETVEVIKLDTSGYESSATYIPGMYVQSLAFPSLSLAVDDIFWTDEELCDTE